MGFNRVKANPDSPEDRKKRLEQMKNLNLENAKYQLENKMISKKTFETFMNEKDSSKMVVFWHDALGTNGTNWDQAEQQLELGYIEQEYFNNFEKEMLGKFLNNNDFFDAVLTFEGELIQSRDKGLRESRTVKEDSERKKEMKDIEDEISGLA